MDTKIIYVDHDKNICSVNARFSRYRPFRAKYGLKVHCKYMFLLTSLTDIINWMLSVRIVVPSKILPPFHDKNKI